MYASIRRYTTGSVFADALVETESEVRRLITGVRDSAPTT